MIAAVIFLLHTGPEYNAAGPAATEMAGVPTAVDRGRRVGHEIIVGPTYDIAGRRVEDRRHEGRSRYPNFMNLVSVLGPAPGVRNRDGRRRCGGHPNKETSAIHNGRRYRTL